MKRFLSLLLACLLTTGIALAAGHKNFDHRAQETFTEIINETDFDIHYYQSLDRDYHVRVVGRPEVASKVETHVRHNVLYITSAMPFFSGRNNVYVEVYCPRLEHYYGKGDGNFIAKTQIHHSGDFKMEMSGKGKANLGHVETRNMHINNDGTGKVKVKEAKNERTEVNNQGTGRIKGNVSTQQFEGKSDGMGSVRMKGQAEKVSTEQKGTGKVSFKRR